MLRLASRGLAARQLCSFAAPRLTKIVATIGPASEEAEPLRGCVAAGLNVMRINFSHATEDEFFLRQRNLRAAPAGELVPIMLDTKGPEIRMGGLRVCKESGSRSRLRRAVARKPQRSTPRPDTPGKPQLEAARHGSGRRRALREEAPFRVPFEAASHGQPLRTGRRAKPAVYSHVVCVS